MRSDRIAIILVSLKSPQSVLYRRHCVEMYVYGRLDFWE